MALSPGVQCVEFRRYTDYITRDPSVVQSWRDRAKWLHEQTYPILAIADAYKAAKLAETYYGAEADINDDSQESIDALDVVKQCLGELNRYTQDLEPGPNSQDRFEQSQVWLQKRTMEALHTPVSGRHQFPWMEVRSVDAKQRAIACFSTQHRLVLKQSSVSTDPNVLGVFTRPHKNAARLIFKKGEDILTELAVTDDQQRVPYVLDSENRLLEHYIRRLATKHLYISALERQARLRHNRASSISDQRWAVPRPSTMRIIFEDHKHDRNDSPGSSSVRAAKKLRTGFMSLVNRNTRSGMEQRAEYALSKAKVRMEIPNVMNSRLVTFPLSIPISNVAEINPATMDRPDVEGLGLNIIYKRRPRDSQFIPDNRAYYRSLNIERMNSVGLGLSDPELDTLTITFGTPLEPFCSKLDVTDIVDLVDRLTDSWHPDLDFWRILAIKWKLETNSFRARDEDGRKTAEGLAKYFSFFNHSCKPNAAFVPTDVHHGSQTRT
ncbi:hypothetical protein FKW77_006035 [Venturia effusa]|uniref:SET domain-containing protein n=1 Tax=Venturia effusa TaxID=50376 RepID=A0A517L1G2_9PEZI|nr:hypothetical protein FKW77_006035 [Venturia effusa]